MPKQLDFYYQADITRKNLVILQEKKQRNNSRNIIAIIVLLLLPLFSQPPSLLFMPKPLESKIPAKYLDHEPKDLDLLIPMEPEPDTPRKQFIPRLLGRTIY
jgi:hypothetical protein